MARVRIPRVLSIVVLVVLVVAASARSARAHDRLVHDAATGEYRCETVPPCLSDDECTAPDVCVAPPGDPTAICHRPEREVWCCTMGDHECPDGTCVPVSASGPGGSPGSVCLDRAGLIPFCGTIMDGEIAQSVLDQCFQSGGSPVTRWSDGDCDGDTTVNGDEGTCPCVECAPMARDGGGTVGPPPPPPRSSGFDFRGGGGCVCGAAGARTESRSWPLALLLPLALAYRRARGRPRPDARSCAFTSVCTDPRGRGC
jgi:hypothetical protein